MQPLDEQARARVADAVARAEAGTDGEIVTILAASSDTYRDVPLLYGLFAAMLAPALLALDPLALPVFDPWAEPDPRHVVLAAFGAAVLLFFIGWALARAGVKRGWLIPKSIKRGRVRAQARALFRVAAEQRTERRFAVLLYLSAAERMAEIVADQALHQAAGPQAWGEAMAALVAPLREGRLADGLVGAVERIGAEMARHFPKTAGDTNELPDRLIML